MVALYALWYNPVRIHKSPRTTPAMAAGIETRLWSMEDVVAMIDEHTERIAPKLADRLEGKIGRMKKADGRNEKSSGS